MDWISCEPAYVLSTAGAILHGLFDLWPSILTEFAAPVNESIWEHMKIVFWPLLVGLLVLYGGKKLASSLATLLMCSGGMLLFGWIYHIVIGNTSGFTDIAFYVLLMALGCVLPAFLEVPRDLDALAFGRDSFAGGPDGNLYDHAAGFPSVPRCVTGGRMGSISLLRNQIQPVLGHRRFSPKMGETRLCPLVVVDATEQR